MSIRSQETALTSLIQRRSEVLNKLTLALHVPPSVTMNYGKHNPFLVNLATCEVCGKTPAEPRASTAAKNRTSWVVVCSCGEASGDGQREAWMASLMWNSRNLMSQCYRDLPLFDLSCLDPAAARARIREVRESLTLRIKLCSLDSAIAAEDRTHPRPGQLYRRRLDAYLKWAMLASRLIKISAN